MGWGNIKRSEGMEETGMDEVVAVNFTEVITRNVEQDFRLRFVSPASVRVHLQPALYCLNELYVS